MPLQSICSLNLFIMLVAGYIGIMDSEKYDTIFMMELKVCPKRIYDIPKFIFYALGDAIGCIPTGIRPSIKGFFWKRNNHNSSPCPSALK